MVRKYLVLSRWINGMTYNCLSTIMISKDFFFWEVQAKYFLTPEVVAEVK